MAGVSIIASLLSYAGVARAASPTALFDLEDQPTSAATALTTLTLSQGGESVTITRDGGAAFGITDLSPFSGTVAFGMRSIIPDQSSNAPFVATFSPPAASVSVMFGHFGADNADLNVQAFNTTNADGTPVVVSSDTLTGVDANTFTLESVEADGVGIRSARFIGGVNGDNSVFYDNIAVGSAAPTAIPLPTAAWSGFATLGALGLAALRRRLRSSVA